MTDTLVVISPPVSAPDGAYNAVSISLGNRLSAGATAAQVAAPYYNNGGMTADCLAWLTEYIKTHNINDQNVQKIISGNIGLFCEADRDLVYNPKMMVMSAFGSNKAYNYKNENINQMSGNVTTPIVALAHYLWGNGEERSVPLNNIGLKLEPAKLPPVINIVNAGGTGSFTVNERFNYSTVQDSVFTGAYLGNISLHTTGTLTISANGTWNYSGVVRAYKDVYDANPSTHRGSLGEMSTTILRYLNGKPYEISIPGEIRVSGSGKR